MHLGLGDYSLTYEFLISFLVYLLIQKMQQVITACIRVKDTQSFNPCFELKVDRD